MTRTRLIRAIALFGLATLSACTLSRPTNEVVNADAGTQTISKNARAFAIDSAKSEILVKVYRGGRLAKLGHNHVISITDLNGLIWLADDLPETVFDLQFSVDRMTVDDKQQRSDAGDDFASDVSEKDKAGTKKNMLSSELLDGAAHPVIQLESSAISRSDNHWMVETAITLKDHRYTITLPAILDIGNGTLTASGKTTVAHSEIGLKPFSVFLGALRVEENITIEYRLQATRTNEKNPAEQ